MAGRLNSRRCPFLMAGPNSCFVSSGHNGDERLSAASIRDASEAHELPDGQFRAIDSDFASRQRGDHLLSRRHFQMEGDGAEVVPQGPSARPPPPPSRPPRQSCWDVLTLLPEGLNPVSWTT